MTTDALTEKRQNLLKSCFKELQSCIDYVHSYSDNKEQQFEVLKSLAKDYSETEIQHARAQQARRATENHLDDQENDCTEDVQQLYNKYLEEQPSNSSYKTHSFWRKINNIIDGKKVEDDSVMDVDISDIEDANESIDEEGIIPSQFEPPIDPLTKKVIQNPCKNKACGHIYEYETLMEHLKRIKQNKSKSRCPYIGCTNVNMRPSFIVKDRMLQQQIENYLANSEDAANTTVSSSGTHNESDIL